MKTKGIDKIRSIAIAVIDISQSMSNLYARGFVQQVIERLTPMALAMTDNGEMQIYVFHNRCFRVFPNLTKDNYEGYVNKYILNKYTFGGTQYAPAIDMVLDNFMTDTANVTINTQKTEKGFNLWPFSKKSQTEEISTIAELPTYVQFYTDGDAQDPSEAEKAIIRASKHGIFWQKVGMKTDSRTDFALLKKLDEMPGRFVDNANFFEATPNDIANSDDEVFYGKLLAEYPEWIEKAKKLKIIK